MTYKKKVLLLILDGVGVAPKSPGNAVALANMGNLSKLWERYLGTYLEASGEDVGLVENTNGNSEVGHLTIGSGKIHYQNLLKIDKSIEKGLFFSNPTLKNLVNHSKKNNSRIHLMGCLSDGSVHAHINHFFAVLKFLSQENFTGEVIIHAFTDGRDTPQKAAIKYLNELEIKLKEFGMGKIATICGRAYAMDRNGDLEKTKKAYDLIANGKGQRFANWQEAIKQAYTQVESDEYIQPISLLDDSSVKDNDAVLFMNFRPDRAIQLSRFIEKAPLKNLFFAGMAEYETDFPQNILFLKEYLSLPLGRIISDAGYQQLRLAESEKFPHVTYFFNGGQPIQFTGEYRLQIPSPRVATYDLQPEMSAYGVLNAFDQAIEKNRNFSFITMNFANGDMVGHTGNLQAGIQAMKVLDDVVLKAVKNALKLNWTILITADHGNVERMIEPGTQLPNTEHSQNPVPLLLIDNTLMQGRANKRLRMGTLSDISPTILKLMGIEKPSVMTGQSLI